MKRNYFIILILFVSLFTFLSCAEKEETKYDYTQTEKPVKKYKSKFKKNIEGFKEEQEEYSNGNSYWFVVWEVKGKPTKVNTFIKQPHEGFSMKEFKKENGDDTFLVNLVEVSKETYIINQ